MLLPMNGCPLGPLLLAAVLLWTGVSARSKPDLLQMQFSVTHRNAREISECNVNCTTSQRRPVCGTDGRTYLNRCEIKRLRRCEKRRIDVASSGPCSGPPGLSAGARSMLRPSSSSSSSSTSPSSSVRPFRGSKCLEERQQAVEMAKRPSPGVYIPECRADGTFAEVQCHQATGYCWCVHDDGKPIPGSSVRGKKINCRGTKGCNPTDRSAFNSNLIKLFSEEFERIPKPTPPTYPGAPKDLPIKSESDSILDTPEKRVIEWKFSELDANKDNKLRKKEIRSLKRMVKRLVRPKPCARNFDKYCDLDQDGNIARTEWSVCLGVDINNEQQTTPTPPDVAAGGIPLHSHDVTSADVMSSASIFLRSTADAVDTDEPGNARGPTLWEKQSTALISAKSRAPASDRGQRQMPARRSCVEERRAAEDMDRMDPEGRIFIPNCSADGKFRSEQCHKSTGYCWCVDRVTGKPIPGTSTHNVMPDCSDVRGRAFKGCPYPQKKRFLTELLDQMTTEMMEYVKNSTDKSNMPEPNPDHSLEERVVRWKLRMLDKNRNDALERRDLKEFKKDIRKRKNLRKCGRNFVKYCDANNDKRITIDEWIDCMGLNDQQRNLPLNPKRRGPNPFSKYLRS